MSETAAGIEYTKVAEIKGPLMIIDGITRASFDELVEIETPDKERRLGRVLEVGYGKAVVQVFEGNNRAGDNWDKGKIPWENYGITRFAGASWSGI